MTAHPKQHGFLANDRNKNQFIHLLKQRLSRDGHNVKQSEYDADTLTLFDIGFFLNRQPWEGGHEGPPHHNFVVIAPMIMKFGTGVKLDVFYTMVTKKICDITTITSL